jgi:hypothetical protein
MQVRSCFLLLAMPTRVVSEKFKPMKIGLCTEILRLGVPWMIFSFMAKRMF